MNAIQRHELYVLEEGEEWVMVTEDTKIPNAATIKIRKQDHTLGNMLRHQLLANQSVLFAGYRVPHPLQPYFLLKIQTDGTITPSQALEKASTDLIGTLTTLETKFRREFQYRDLERADNATAAATVGGGVGGLGMGGGVGGGGGDVGMDASGGVYGEGTAWSSNAYLDIDG
ncbi:RBP11-like subunits of RNA polymerase [Fomitiporia mediterranea MF3/22]|uniref:RBP11-like subunits of RNA polymerase n=1 Tax=Fomitiporia mediterranea (strain MF3/22) TaxID=694068 RepID=UPI00044072F1|nr:RBP11-like subunits of RNA polymerase [Fomitiporia mediterranea MF3/22]EJC99370.1 RBP11-like subunits of RNA polymerase [Fomitiporia mediterranea MF3/22]